VLDFWCVFFCENQRFCSPPRGKMMSPETVAKAVVECILLPADATLETLEIFPTAGTL
jgi:hypothetical protein